jgi:hypothetical protein
LKKQANIYAENKRSATLVNTHARDNDMVEQKEVLKRKDSARMRGSSANNMQGRQSAAEKKREEE